MRKRPPCPPTQPIPSSRASRPAGRDRPGRRPGHAHEVRAAQGAAPRLRPAAAGLRARRRRHPRAGASRRGHGPRARRGRSRFCRAGAERAVQAERLRQRRRRAGRHGAARRLRGRRHGLERRRAAGRRRAARRPCAAHHVDCTARATVTTVVLADPAHYGRVLRDADGSVTGIVEARDASPGELAVREINVGFYVFDAAELRAVPAHASPPTTPRASTT